MKPKYVVRWYFIHERTKEFDTIEQTLEFAKALLENDCGFEVEVKFGKD